MSERRAVVVFTEGSFEKVYTWPTAPEAYAFSDGVEAGAGYYGAGECLAFVWPDESDGMFEMVDAVDAEIGAIAAEDALARASDEDYAS
jgi:hypothetical protein